jgi:hypothetical protein
MEHSKEPCAYLSISQPLRSAEHREDLLHGRADKTAGLKIQEQQLKYQFSLLSSETVVKLLTFLNFFCSSVKWTS